MKPDDLDRIMSADEEIVPASGLVATVMDMVRREASAPPPIAFPWVRLACGLVAVVGLAALGGFIVAAVFGVIGWSYLRGVERVFERSRKELTRNVNWIKYALKRPAPVESAQPHNR